MYAVLVSMGLITLAKLRSDLRNRAIHLYKANFYRLQIYLDLLLQWP